MSVCLLALGSNLGDRSRHLNAAVQHLEGLSSTRVLAQSSRLETLPLGGPKGQTGFLNAALLVETDESPQSLLRCTQAIERQEGRVETQRWDARPLDIDLLLYDDLSLRVSQLTLPHPWLPVRRFVLQPANEVAAEMRHPDLGWTIRQMFEHLESKAQRFVVTSSQFDHRLPQISQDLSSQYIPDPAPFSVTEPGRLAIPPERQAIESFELRRRAVLDSTWCQPEASAICGFWLGESEVVASRRLTGQALHRFIGDVQRQTETIPSPKLLVHCRPSVSPADEDGWPEWRPVLCRDARFPWLEIEPPNEQRFEDEITAAF